MRIRPKKGKYGYVQGTCDRCTESDLPLIRYGAEYVCDTCARLLKRVEGAKLKIKQVDKDKEFIDRAING